MSPTRGWFSAAFSTLALACGGDGPGSGPEDPEPVASLQISGATDSVRLGKILQLTAQPKDAGGNILTGRVISWSGGGTVLGISSGGVLTALGLGTASITAECEGVTSSVTVRVTPGNVATIEVSPASVTIQAGDPPVQFSATLEDSVGNVITGRPISWSLNLLTEPNYISSTGVLTVLQVTTLPGLVIASVDGKSGNAPYTVTPADDFGTILAMGLLTDQVDLYTVTAAGVGANVTNTAGAFVSEYQGRWSPDGSQIAFTGGFDFACPDWNVFVSDQDGANRLQRTFGSCEAYIISDWSPDGTQLLAGFRTPGGAYGISIIPANGGSPTLLVFDSTQSDYPVQPAWSPDGSMIAFLSFPSQADFSNRAGNVSVIAANGTGRQELVSDQTATDQVTWSPDGSKIAFISGLPVGDLVVMNADGTGRKTITAGMNTTRYAWSPDGSEIAFTKLATHYSDLLIVGADGGSPVPLTAPLNFNGDQLYVLNNFLWSPDGESLAFWGIIGRPNQSGDIVGLDRTFLVRKQDGSILALTLPAGVTHQGLTDWKP